LRLRRRSAEIRRRNEVELEEQRREQRRHRGFYRTPSPSRDARPKQRLFLPPTLPIDQKKRTSSPIPGPSGLKRLPRPPVRPPAPQVPQPQGPVQPQVQPALRQPPPTGREDPLQTANEAWQQAGNSQNILFENLTILKLIELLIDTDIEFSIRERGRGLPDSFVLSILLFNQFSSFHITNIFQ